MYEGKHQIIAIGTNGNIRKGDIVMSHGNITEFPTWWELFSQQTGILKALVVFEMKNSKPLLIEVKDEKLLIKEALDRTSVPGMATLKRDGCEVFVDCDLNLSTMTVTLNYPMSEILDKECTFTLMSNDKIGEVKMRVDGYQLKLNDKEKEDALFRLASGEEPYSKSYRLFYSADNLAIMETSTGNNIHFWEDISDKDRENLGWFIEDREERLLEVSQWLSEESTRSHGKETESSVAMEEDIAKMHQMTDDIIWVSMDSNQMVFPSEEPELSDKLATEAFPEYKA